MERRAYGAVVSAVSVLVPLTVCSAGGGGSLYAQIEAGGTVNHIEVRPVWIDRACRHRPAGVAAGGMARSGAWSGTCAF